MASDLNATVDSAVRAAATAADGSVALFGEHDTGGLRASHELPTQRLSLAIVVWPVATEVVAALRDQWAERVLVLADAGAEPAALVALGFTPVSGEGAVQRFEFDIGHYKTTPDWLNAKGWANPQHWDKYRW